MGLKLVTVPEEEPIDLDAAKKHLRVEHEDEDLLITSLITAARETAEITTGRAFLTQEWELTLDAFPAAGFDLPRPPLQSVTSVKYLDVNGVEQTLATAKYLVDTRSEPGRVTPAYGEIWPSTRNVINAVTVKFKAGYGAVPEVPESLKSAIKLLLSHFYEIREPVNVGNIVTEIPLGVERLLWQHKVVTFA